MTRTLALHALLLSLAVALAIGATTIAPATTQSDLGLKLEKLRKKDDSIKLRRDGDVTILEITSISGIGDAQLVRTGERWPKELRLEFRYGDGKPFEMLESLGVTIRDGAGKDIWTDPVQKADPKKPIVLKIPADTKGTKLAISWIDAYR